MTAHSVDTAPAPPAQPYHLGFFREELAGLDLAGRDVLEIGCGFGHVLRLLAAHEPRIDRLVGISDQEYDQPPHPGYDVLRADACAMPFEGGSFDLVYALATFEHIRNLPRALAEMHRVLRPGGRVISVFSPIWSGFNGHHYGSELSSGGDHDIDLPWAHLALSPRELERHLIDGEGFEPLEAARAVHSIYDDPWLNRLHLREYRNILADSPLAVERFERLGAHRADMQRRIDRCEVRNRSTAAAIRSLACRQPEDELLVYKLKLTLVNA